MANVLINEETLTGIADAIREKKNADDTYLPSEMPDAIKEISGGSAYEDVFEALDDLGNQDDLYVYDYDFGVWRRDDYIGAPMALLKCVRSYDPPILCSIDEHGNINNYVRLDGDSICSFDSSGNLAYTISPGGLYYLDTYGYEEYSLYNGIVGVSHGNVVGELGLGDLIEQHIFTEEDFVEVLENYGYTVTKDE